MSSVDRIIEMINEQNHPTYPLSEANVTLSLPTVDVETGWNTRITVNAVPNSGYRDSVEIFVTRTPLSAMGSTIELTQEDPFTADSACALINTLKHAELTADDFANLTIPEMDVLTVTAFEATANVNSLVWLGNVQISLLTGIPAESEGLHTFLNSDAAALFAQSNP